jgi:hypothetical protein
MARYRVLQGIDYPPNKRAEVGDTVDDIPTNAIKWLVDTGAIEDASKPAKKVEAVIEPVIEEPEVIIEPVVEESQAEPSVVLDVDAIDEDGDGFIQDGTPFQRPVEEK